MRPFPLVIISASQHALKWRCSNRKPTRVHWQNNKKERKHQTHGRKRPCNHRNAPQQDLSVLLDIQPLNCTSRTRTAQLQAQGMPIPASFSKSIAACQFARVPKLAHISGKKRSEPKSPTKWFSCMGAAAREERLTDQAPMYRSSTQSLPSTKPVSPLLKKRTAYRLAGTSSPPLSRFHELQVAQTNKVEPDAEANIDHFPKHRISSGLWKTVGD